MEVFHFLQPYMEECFQESCQFIQTELEIHANGIWKDFGGFINGILDSVVYMQRQDKKGDIQYLSFSFLRYGIYLDRLELRMDVLDDGFYLDEREAAGYYCPIFLQDRYLRDLTYLYQKAEEKFIRMQEYELVKIKNKYTGFYKSILLKIVESLSELIVEEVEKSGVYITDDFKIIYGEYMDSATVVYAKEKSQDEIFSNRNG